MLSSAKNNPSLHLRGNSIHHIPDIYQITKKIFRCFKQDVIFIRVSFFFIKSTPESGKNIFFYHLKDPKRIYFSTNSDFQCIFNIFQIFINVLYFLFYRRSKFIQGINIIYKITLFLKDFVD